MGYNSSFLALVHRVLIFLCMRSEHSKQSPRTFTTDFDIDAPNSTTLSLATTVFPI